MPEVFQGRLPVDLASGAVKTVVSGLDAGPYTYQNGLKIDSTGAVVVVGSGAAVYHNRWALDANGNLLITATPVTPLVQGDGLNFDANGCICVSSGAAVAFQNGLPIDASGNLIVTSHP
jgi:sugar lactone lactonase YvrE